MNAFTGTVRALVSKGEGYVGGGDTEEGGQRVAVLHTETGAVLGEGEDEVGAGRGVEVVVVFEEHATEGLGADEEGTEGGGGKHGGRGEGPVGGKGGGAGG